MTDLEQALMALRSAGMPKSMEIVEAEIKRLTDEAADHDRSFDIRWKADMRAIKRWQAAHPGNDLVWPDHADLCVWLMEWHDRMARAIDQAIDLHPDLAQLSEFKAENAHKG